MPRVKKPFRPLATVTLPLTNSALCKKVKRQRRREAAQHRALLQQNSTLCKSSLIPAWLPLVIVWDWPIYSVNIGLWCIVWNRGLIGTLYIIHDFYVFGYNLALTNLLIVFRIVLHKSQGFGYRITQHKVQTFVNISWDAQCFNNLSFAGINCTMLSYYEQFSNNVSFTVYTPCNVDPTSSPFLA